MPFRGHAIAHIQQISALRILPTVPQHLSTVFILHFTFHILQFHILPTAFQPFIMVSVGDMTWPYQLLALDHTLSSFIIFSMAHYVLYLRSQTSDAFRLHSNRSPICNDFLVCIFTLRNI